VLCMILKCQGNFGFKTCTVMFYDAGGVLFSLVVVAAPEWCLRSRAVLLHSLPKGFVVSFGWNHLQHVRMAVALARANFLLFFG